MKAYYLCSLPRSATTSQVGRQREEGATWLVLEESTNTVPCRILVTQVYLSNSTRRFLPEESSPPPPHPLLINRHVCLDPFREPQ